MTISPHARHDKTAACRDTPTSVYRYYDDRSLLLYVGVTSRGIARNVEHNTSKEWFQFVTRQEVEHYPARPAALKREKELIRKYRPPFNKQHNPGSTLIRQAYLAYAAAPEHIRAVAVRSPSKLPKSLWFVIDQYEETAAVLKLSTPMPTDWNLTEPVRIRLKDNRKRPCGRLTSVRRIGDETLAEVELPIGTDRLMAVELHIKWPPVAQPTRTCEIISARAHFFTLTEGVA